MILVGSIMVLLTMISRMYLGSHFLADVIGGAIIGSFVSFAIIYIVKASNYLNAKTHDLKSLTFLWLPFFLIFFAPYSPHWLGGIIIVVYLAAFFTFLM